jgi:hypothetical protein
MTDDLLALQVLDGLDLWQRDEPVIPVVLGLSEVSEPFFAFGSLSISLVM